MTKGRKSLPTVQKKAQGTIRKCRQNPAEPPYQIVKSLPDPPAELGGRGRELYYTAGMELSDKGILTSISMGMFLEYCQAMETAETAYKEMGQGITIMDENGKTYVNPAFRVYKDSVMIAVRIACEFGMTPASSSKVVVPAVKRSKLDDFIK